MEKIWTRVATIDDCHPHGRSQTAATLYLSQSLTESHPHPFPMRSPLVSKANRCSSSSAYDVYVDGERPSEVVVRLHGGVLMPAIARGTETTRDEPARDLTAKR